MTQSQSSVKDRIPVLLRLRKIDSFGDGIARGIIVGGIYGAIILISYFLEIFLDIRTWSNIPQEFLNPFEIVIKYDPTYPIWLSFFIPLLFAMMIGITSYFSLRCVRDCLICGLSATVGYAGFFLMVYLKYSPLIIDYAWEKYWLYTVTLNVTVFLLFVWIAGYTGIFVNKKLKTKVSSTEDRVLKYIIDHGYKIQISKCAEDLNIPVADVENAIKSLRNKRILRQG